MHGALYRDCQRCGGYGSFGHGDMIKCPACHGNGVIALSTEEMAAINAPIMAGKGRREAGASFVERFREAVGEDAWASIPEYLQIWIMTKAISVHLGLSTPPVGEEGRREVQRTELCYLIERMCPDKPESNLGNPVGSQVEELADAILALTPVEGVGDDDLLKRSASAEQAYANIHPENAATIARIIDGYHFDTPSDRARAHEVARAMAGHPRATPATAQGDAREAPRRFIQPMRYSPDRGAWVDCSDATATRWAIYENPPAERVFITAFESAEEALATLGAPHEG